MRFRVFLISFSLFISAHASAGIFDFLDFLNFGSNDFNVSEFNKKFSESFLHEDEWPESIHLQGQELVVNYSFDKRLDEYIKKILKRYHPDFASVVVMETKTGKILSAIDYDRKRNTFGRALTFSSTHPAASIFKIVTAAELLRDQEINPTTIFDFVGRSTTLYKYQLKDATRRRWRRSQTLENAFAKSNNVIFGKAAINHLNTVGLMKMAQNFGFNKKLMSEVSLGRSVTYLPENQYSLAELASGFNRKTLISPVHGAVIASIIANDGKMPAPQVVTSIYDKKENELVWSPEVRKEEVLDKKVAAELRQMMALTLKSGTARGAFRRALRRSLFKKLEMGGKTGSITGGLPYGKRDWFVSYVKPEQGYQARGISLSVMIVNQKKWYIKSPYLAKSIIEYFYKEVDPVAPRELSAMNTTKGKFHVERQ